MLRDDLLTSPRTSAELERFADAYADVMGFRGKSKLDGLWLLEHALPELMPTFALVVRNDEVLADALAVTFYDPIRIEVSERAYQAARRDHPRAHHTLVHEFAHVALHPRLLPKPLKDSRQERLLAGEMHLMGTEVQADTLAALMMCQRSVVEGLTSIRDVVIECRVPYEIALVAVRHYGERFRRLLPYDKADLFTVEESPL